MFRQRMTGRQMKRRTMLAGLVLALCVPAWAVGQERPTPAELTTRAKVIKPSAAELKWQRIPWITDLTKAQGVAQRERRPVFLWVTGDDPLERC